MSNHAPFGRSEPASTTLPYPAFKRIGHPNVFTHLKLLASASLIVPLHSGIAQNTLSPATPTAPAQSVSLDAERYQSPVAPTSTALQPAAVLLDGAYAANATIGSIIVELSEKAAIADGRTPVSVTVKLLDKAGKPVAGEALVTIENTGGRLLLPGAVTPQFGAATNDADRNVPGTQFKLVNGAGSFDLIAPDTAGEVKLRLTAGGAVAEGVIGFNPDVRPMIAAGLIEGSLRLSSANKAQFKQARISDGFEQEIRNFTKSFNNGKGELAARASVFLKGKIKGAYLLTLAYDSDKETRARLLRDIKPEQVYPVYGDASVKGFDARSSDKLYVRIDNKRNYLLYGDYSSGSEFSQGSGAGIVASGNLRQLGAYNRTITGLRTHLEDQRGFINVMAARDSLKQVVEEFAANGTSGPIAVKSNAALENSEKVEIVTRDKNARDRVIAVTALQRLVDYTFEPFSGRVLLARPLPSLDSNGNPVSIRITYEVDQGGDQFWVAGVDGEANVLHNVTLGGSFVKDYNPLSPYQLGSVNTGIRFGDHTSFVAEVAQSRARTYSQTAGGAKSVFPTDAAGEITEDATGVAGRFEFLHENGPLKAKLWYLLSDANFSNSNSGLLANREEIGFDGRTALRPDLAITSAAQRTADRGTDARRDNASIGLNWRANSWLQVSAGARMTKEVGSLGATAGISQTSNSGGSIFNQTGGFNGGGASNIIDPTTGLPSLGTDSNASTPLTSSSTGTNVDATTAYLGLKAKVSKRAEVSASAEVAIDDNRTSAQSRAAKLDLGASYQLAERSRAYVRAETQTGLASSTSLDAADQSSSVLVGLDTSYREGQSVYSEYRLRDATSDQNTQWVTGLRNAFQIKEGLVASFNAEYLKVLNPATNKQGSDAYAVGAGIDFTAAQLWKGNWKVDYRHVNDIRKTDIDESADSYLSNLTVARKLDRNWTLLFRNYTLVSNNRSQLGSATSPASASTSLNPRNWQNRAQLGAAFRPTDSNRFDALMKIEYKLEDNINYQDESNKTWIGSVAAVWHPSRPWVINGRLAAKTVHDRFYNSEGGTSDSYTAFLVSGRVIYDITEKWDLGLLTSVLTGHAADQTGNATQYAFGGAIGRSLASNIWVSGGYNVTGFRDADLAGSDYTNKGFYLTLRFKFDENLLKRGDPAVNHSHTR